MLKANLNLLRENVFYYSLILFVVSLPFSEAFVSISVGVMLFQAIIFTFFKHNVEKSKSKISFFMISSIFVIYLLGIMITEDLPFAFYELKKVIFWVILPLTFYLSPKISREKFYNLLIVFCIAVFVASIFTVLKMIIAGDFLINEFRVITLVSHIRFSFQVLLSIIIATYFIISRFRIFSLRYSNLILFIFIIWMIIFMNLLKSITGIIALFGTSMILLLFIIKKRNNKFRVVGILALLFIVFLPIIYVASVWRDFYDIEQVSPYNVDKYTESGNLYYFDFSSHQKENGNLERLYICESELRSEWNKRSQLKYDSLNSHGYPYSSTLIRYLTSKGLRKDSIGVNSLTKNDIYAVEKGIANHIFIDKKFSIYPRIYETIWELDRYFRTGDPNYQSFSQRIEFVKAALVLIKKNPIFGIGTGNWKIKYAEAYNEMNSKLIKDNQGPAHNQYINYMVKFGIIGFVYILSMLIIPVFRENHKSNLLFLLFLVSIAIVNLGDSNLESHMGLSFICFFYCLFLWNSPDEIKKFTL